MSRTDHNLDHEHESVQSRTKVHQSGRGRRANRVSKKENPLGSFLQSRMERNTITQTDFARMIGISRDKVRRLISRDPQPIEIQDWLVARIIQALDMSATEQEEFNRLLSGGRSIDSPPPILPEASAIDATGTASEGAVWLSIPSASVTLALPAKRQEVTEEKYADERGRKAVEPQPGIGTFLAEHLQAKGIKRSDLARTVKVDPATVTRLIEGKTAIRDETREQICLALGLNEAERLEFGRLIPKGRTADISVHKYSNIDFECLIERLLELHGYYEKGQAEYVLLEARRFYQQLRRAPFTKEEIRAIDLQWRFGMLSGSANEAVQAWEDRVLPTINLYDLVQSDIESTGISPKKAETYIAHIQARRAPLYRQLKDYDRSRREFTKALDVYSRYKEPRPEDRRLIVELYYSRAHVYAVQGKRIDWERDIQFARMWAEAEKDEMRHRELVGLVDYTEGEGFKRLAFNEYQTFSRESREEFALKGLELFKISHMEESRWIGHRILNQVARVQCLAFIDPAAALKEAENLRTVAEQHYRSIIQKIDQVIDYARKQLL
ncbi:MAG: helix-turn-helix domain-containing protein [Ktedonobacteraceae bacterium]